MMAIANRETLTTRTMDIVRSNLELLDTFFERFSHVMAWQRPTAGTIGFPRLVEAGADVDVQISRGPYVGFTPAHAAVDLEHWGFY